MSSATAAQFLHRGPTTRRRQWYKLTKTAAFDHLKIQCFPCDMLHISMSVDGQKNIVSSGALSLLFCNEKRWMPIIKTTMATNKKDGMTVHNNQSRQFQKTHFDETSRNSLERSFLT
jgi:hypothetical protein